LWLWSVFAFAPDAPEETDTRFPLPITAEVSEKHC
jgi:hypothetical protein